MERESDPCPYFAGPKWHEAKLRWFIDRQPDGFARPAGHSQPTTFPPAPPKANQKLGSVRCTFETTFERAPAMLILVGS
jgi:hypothetical protein